MISWKIDPNSTVPIYKQLVNLVRASVACGELRKGEVLPSQRQLAKLLGLSRATIVKAMTEMADAGLIDIQEIRRSSPTFLPKAFNGMSISVARDIDIAISKRAAALTMRKLISLV